MSSQHQLGKEGELIAVDHLTKKGYEILETNYRFLKAEVDIIAKKKSTYIAVEVKMRSDDHFGLPQEFIKPGQIKNIVKAMDAFMQEHELQGEVRLDVIAITGTPANFRIEHLEDAFYHF